MLLHGPVVEQLIVWATVEAQLRLVFICAGVSEPETEHDGGAPSFFDLGVHLSAYSLPFSRGKRARTWDDSGVIIKGISELVSNVSR